MSASRDRVLSVAQPVVEAAGYDLDELSVMAAGRRRLVRVMIDSDAGVDLDDAAALSRDLSDALDDSEAMGETPYVLEVTSRGVDRPLTLPRHWRRATTRLVKVTTVDDATILGRVVACDDDAVTLLVPTAPEVKGRAARDDAGVAVVVPFVDVAQAVVQVEFNRRDTDGADVIDDTDDTDDSDDTTSHAAHDDDTGRS